jgi:methyltransferase family protein
MGINILRKTKSVAYMKIKELYQTLYFGDKHLEQAFSRVYRERLWRSGESASGTGSVISQTNVIRRELPILIKELNIGTLLDAACGDFNWMQHIELDLQRYIGCDVVPELINRNRQMYANPVREFRVLDITKDEIPTVDLILCRQCLNHLSVKYIHSAIAHFKKSRSKYLLVTTCRNAKENRNTLTGLKWRSLNMQLPPFNFPDPIKFIIEERDLEYDPEEDVSLGLWELANL